MHLTTSAYILAYVKGQLAGAAVSGGIALLGKLLYGPVETALLAARGMPSAIYPLDSAAQWVIPAAVGIGVGAVCMFAPKFVGATLAALAAGALVEAARRRSL